MSRPVLAALAAAVIASGAAAQEMLTPDEFLDRARGHTLTFVDAPSGVLIGVEQFLSRTRSVYARADGTCAYGTVTVEGPELCFRYDDDPARLHCWWPFQADGHMHVRLAQPDTGEVQRVDGMSDNPVMCRPQPNV